MIKLNDVEIKLDKYPDGTFLFKDISPIGPKNLIEWFFESMEEMSAIIYLTQYCKDQGTKIYLDMVKKLFILSIVNRCTKMDTNFTYLKMEFG